MIEQRERERERERESKNEELNQIDEHWRQTIRDWLSNHPDITHEKYQKVVEELNYYAQKAKELHQTRQKQAKKIAAKQKVIESFQEKIKEQKNFFLKVINYHLGQEKYFYEEWQKEIYNNSLIFCDLEQAEETNACLARWLVDENHLHQQTQEELTRTKNKKTKATKKIKQLVKDKQNLNQKISQLEQSQTELQASQAILAKILVEINTELDNEKLRADNLQEEKNQHVCPAPGLHPDYDTIQQERDNWKKKSEEHVCPSVDNSELVAKDKKIAELEAELKKLRDKPPIQSDNSELKQLLTEKENWLAVIQEKEKIIQQLEVKLQSQIPREVIKEVEKGEVIQGLKNKLAKKEEKIKQLHLIYLVLLVVSMVGLVRARLARKKRLKSIRK